MNYIEFTVLKAFTSEFKLRPYQSLQWNVCAAHVNNFSSNLVERVDFSDSRVALLWAGLEVFPRVTVSLHILYTANQETEGSQDRLTI